MSTHLPGVAGQVSNISHDNTITPSIAPPDHGKRVREWLVAIGTFATVGSAVAGFLALRSIDADKTAAPSASLSTAQPINITVNNSSTSSASMVRPEGAPSKPISPQPSPAPVPTLSPYERYVNASATRVAGALNVALALRGLPGHPPAPLEGAMERALLDRGMSIVPLFRDAFRKDGLEKRLFTGDASLVGALKLRTHVDSVLVGELRFVGPAQLVGDEHYIREAVLEIHAVDPTSGRIVRTLQIKEKGGGENEELSTVNALDRLEQKVEASLSEWTWV